MSPEHPEATSPLKPFDQMLEGEFREGMASYRRSNFGLFVSSISAGMDLSFGVLLLAIANSLLADTGELASRFVLAALYPVGFIFVILGRAELFTEQTTLAIIPVLHGRASLTSLCRLWGIVYIGNLLGITAMVALFVILGPPMGIAAPADFTAIAEGLSEPAAWVIVLSGAVAGWLMGLLSWLLTAARDTISQIVLVWLVGAMIGIAELHHSIKGAGEVLAGIFAREQLTVVDFGRFLLWATVGNILGAIVFAMLLKYSEGARGARLRRMDEAADRKSS